VIFDKETVVNDDKGFTLIELAMVVTIIVLMSAIALPNMLSSREAANFQVCNRNRQTIEQAEGQYLLDHNEHSTGVLGDLLEDGYVDANIRCPSGGIYYWVTYLDNDERYRTLIGCSVHGEDKTINKNILHPTGNEDEDGDEAPPPESMGG